MFDANKNDVHLETFFTKPSNYFHVQEGHKQAVTYDFTNGPVTLWRVAVLMTHV